MFTYRGFMLDSARHWQPIEEIKQLIDAMAKLNFNVFHWHLTEDQGWRFESERYPLLNTKAAVRAYSDFGKTFDSKPYGRVYTKQEMREIVAYCAARGINVVPEFDMPGHVSALLSVFPELSCNGKEVKVKTHQGIYKDVLCPANDKAYEIVFSLLEEFLDIFPYEYFHIGGDEAPSDRWAKCPACRQKMQSLGISDYTEYQNVFMNRIIDFLEQHGRHAIVWNEAARGKNLDKRAVIQYWKENEKASIDYINGGGKAILSPFSYYYMDYGYEITSLKRTYSFNPRLKGLTEEGYANILGIEAPLWTEYIDDAETAQRLLFPRMLAVAATANGEDRLPYSEFVKKVKERRADFPDILFEEERHWHYSRLRTPLGWLKFTRSHYTKEFIESARQDS